MWAVIKADIPVLLGKGAKEAIAKAAGLAMERMAKKMVMEASRLTREEYNIKASDAKSGMYYKRKWVKGTIKGLGFSINVRSKRFGLEYFQPRARNVTYTRKVWKDWRRKKKVQKRYKAVGVSVKIKRGAPREMVGRGFMLPRGKAGVFMRRRKADNYPSRPITKLATLSMYETLKANADKQAILDAGLETFRKNWRANFKHLVTRRYRIKMQSQR